MFVRGLASTNPNALDEHRVALVPTFSSLQTTMRRLWNPDKNDFRERHGLMSVMLTLGLFVRRHSVVTQQPCPDRFVRAKSFTAENASGNPHESPEIVPQQPGWHAQQDSMLNCASVSSRISPDLPPCFFHFVCQSHRCRLSVTPQPFVLVKEILNEFDQSSGRVVSGLLSHFTKNKSASTATRVVAYFCSVSPLADVVFTNAKSNAITGSCSPFSRKSLRRCGSSFPRPMTHSSHHGAGGKWFTMWYCRSTSEG